MPNNTTSIEETIKQMWESRVVNYPGESTPDEAYKHGWEMGYRFAHNQAYQQGVSDTIERVEKEVIGEDEDSVEESKKAQNEDLELARSFFFRTEARNHVRQQQRLKLNQLKEK